MSDSKWESGGQPLTREDLEQAIARLEATRPLWPLVLGVVEWAVFRGWTDESRAQALQWLKEGCRLVRMEGPDGPDVPLKPPPLTPDA